MDRFDLRTAVLFGKSAFESVLKDAKRVFIVTDGFLVKNGAVRYVTDFLEQNSTAYQIFDQVKPDPDIETVAAGNQAIIAFQPDMVVALGGGSPIDAAKAMVYFAQKQFDLKDCPFIAIPTTSGTGSEVSKFSVITHKEKGQKYPLVDPSLLPDYAVLDAALTKTVPACVTADTGMDVMTHAIEAYSCTQRNTFTDALAEKAVKLVYANLMKCCRHPDDLAAREMMHHASCLAGAAFSNSGLGLCHAMAHALGGRFHVPHGRANAILLPYVMSFLVEMDSASQSVSARYELLASELGLKAFNQRQSALNFIRTVRNLSKDAGIPSSFAQTGIDETAFHQQCEAMALAALSDTCMGASPYVPAKEQIIHLYQQAYSGNMRMSPLHERRPSLEGRSG